ncbi:hypothetical protein HU200_036107 [Digitaria exilis]|uniref:Cytochrome P450 n=1 Tax=Digitaria exilis TaxID=1010633 RepID=A0A835BH65_9POAL|nr:hypothetical protein HU200_036107 [Digitaria exilis]
MAQQTLLDHLAAGSPAAVKASFPLLVPVLLLLLLRYLATGAKTKQAATNRLPPSPPAMPLIGHLHLVGAHPHISMRSLAARHGDLMLLRLGTVPTLVASSPRAAQALLRTHDQSLASRPSSILGDILGYGPADVGFAPYGDGWRQAKKLVTTHLLNAKKVLVEGLDKKFKSVMEDSMAALGGFNLENFYPGLAKVAGGVLMWPVRRKGEKLRDRWDEVLDKVIDGHASMAAAAGASERHESDFTDVLLSVKEEYGITRNGMKGILSDMFAAGTDTAYLVLEYTMIELIQHQDIMAKLQEEVRSSIPKGQEVITEDNLTGMSYLRAVIKETLRLHPPSPLLLPHSSREDCNIDNYMVPAGTTVFVNVWAIGRDPSLWEAPEEFMPERFINKESKEGAIDFRGLDFQFLPFGSGRRMCPGMNFALANVEIMLANLVCHFDWEMPKGVNNIDMEEIFGLTVHRKDKLILAPKVTMCC